MGEVYRARDTRLDRDVAIKVLPERTARDAHALSRFRRETKALAALSHPNILMILDVGEHENDSYAVMELLEGDTLRERLRTLGLDWRKALEIAAAIADGLAGAHARGIVHRDIKPENLFLTKNGVVKILDFGLARTGVPDFTDPAAATLTVATQPGLVLGTVNYMSPEQVRGQMTDARCDIFSLGCVLHEMLTGKPPFARETSAETMTAILRHHPVLPSQGGSRVPPGIDPVVAKCLEKNADDRFHSAYDLAFTLRSVLAGSGATVARRRPRLPWPAKAAVGLLLAAALFVGSFMFRRELRLVRREAGKTIDSLAVLPMENVSRDPEQEYFVDGMTEALISDLAKIGGLKVISRTSVMRYKATTKSLPEIAKELNVDAVVEGSVLRVGERVRITAQLIHAATDEHLWTESYDRDLRDVLRLHSELARTIAQEIKGTLTAQEQTRMVEARPINPEAYEAYLKGRFFWDKRTSDDLQKAIEYFEQAVSLDPAWPLGYAGLADAYSLMPWYAAMPPSEAIPKARAAAAKALQMDESLGEAHATMAKLAVSYDWDWPTAEREYDRAIALSPNYATAHQWYSEHLLITGRHDAAIREITKAQELDPLSPVIGAQAGVVHYMAGDFAQAETRLRKTLELNPDFTGAKLSLAITLFLQGRLAEAITKAQEAVRLSNNGAPYAAVLAYVYAKAGQPEEARRILDELTARSTEAYVAPTLFALVHAGLDERDRMFEWLERAYQERDVLLSRTLPDPLLAPMRSDPRFADLLRRVGLPEIDRQPISATGPDRNAPDGETP
jgi:serine/threonine-protein kinase